MNVKRMFCAAIACGLALIFTACTTTSVESPLRFDPVVKRGVLANGLQYALRENALPANRLELRLVVRTGSLQETDDQQGLAHFVEHMAFNGTRRFRKQALVNMLETMGVRFGADLNAYTTFDRTVYKLQVPTDKPELLNKAMWILADWSRDLSFDAIEIDKERGVVIEEWRGRRGADQRMRDLQYPVLYHGSRYAERLPIGKKEILESFNHDQLKAYYRDWYRPDLMSVILVGDMPVDEMERLVKDNFSSMVSQGDSPERVDFDVPGHDETLFAVAVDVEATRSTFSIYHKLPPQPFKTQNDYRRRIMEGLYTQLLNGRLKEIEKTLNSPVLSAYAHKGRFNLSRDYFMLGAECREENIEEGMKLVLVEATRAARFGFTATEVRRQKEATLRNIRRAYEKRDTTPSAAYISRYVTSAVDGRPVVSVEDSLHMYERFVEGITREDVNKVGSPWLTTENRVVLVNAPDKASVSVPRSDALRDLIDKVGEQSLDEYEDIVLDSELVPEDLEAGTVKKSTRIASIGVTEWVLSNGVKVILKPTDFKKNDVLFSAFSPGGHSVVTDKEHVPALTASAITRESGLGAFNQISLRKKLAGRDASASPYIDELDEGLMGGAAIEDLEVMFQLIHLAFVNPRFDVDAFKIYKSRMDAALRNRPSEPGSAFSDMIARTLSRGHFRRRPWSRSMLEELRFEDSRSIYLDRFEDASDFTFVFVGDFKIAKMKALCTRYLASLPATYRNETWKDVGVRYPQKSVQKDMYKGKGEKSQVRMVYGGPFEWSAKNRFLVHSMCRVLSIRLRESLREDLSGTYGVYAYPRFTRVPESEYKILIGYTCAPSSASPLLKAALREIELLRFEDVDEGYITKVKAGALNEHELRLKENGFWLNSLRAAYINGEDPAKIPAIAPYLRDVTPESIRLTAATYFGDNNLSVFMLYPKDAQKKK